MFKQDNLIIMVEENPLTIFHLQAHKILFYLSLTDVLARIQNNKVIKKSHLVAWDIQVFTAIDTKLY